MRAACIMEAGGVRFITDEEDTSDEERPFIIEWAIIKD